MSDGMHDGYTTEHRAVPRIIEDHKTEGSTQTDTDKLLAERGKRYGSFVGHAEITQEFKSVMHCWLKNTNKILRPTQMEALEMIFHKIGRILNGDPDYDDSWQDIAGYAQLEVDRIHGKIT